MRLKGVPAAVLLAACSGGDAIGTREEATFGDVLQVVQAVGVITELAVHGVLGAPETEPVCPAVSRVEGFSTVDYGPGCVPDSGLVPAGLAGSVRLDLGERLVADMDGLVLGGVALDGTLDARATPVSAVETTLRLDQLSPDAVELDLTIGMGQAPPFLVHGVAQRNEGGVGVPLAFEEVELDGGGDCLAPAAGSITIEQGLYEVVFTFDGSDRVAVSRSDGVTGALSPCGNGVRLNEE